MSDGTENIKNFERNAKEVRMLLINVMNLLRRNPYWYTGTDEEICDEALGIIMSATNYYIEDNNM